MTAVIARNARRAGFQLQAGFLSVTRLGPPSGLVAVLSGLGLAWGTCYAAGGSHTGLAHLFYLPIIVGAARFGWVGAGVSAMAAGVLAGPLMPSDVETQTSQPPEAWLLRLVSFVAIGLFMAWLLGGRAASLRAALHDAQIAQRLLQGLRDGEVEIFYQPIVSTVDGAIVAVEALSRWTHPGRGPVSPAVFIPAAERTGAVAELDQFVLREAARQVQTWSAECGPVKVSVNLSATRFAEPALVDLVATVLEDTGLPARQLQLEVTESAVIEDPGLAGRQVQQLRRLGVGVAIDDFGVGQASLGYLHTLGADTVKIDRSLITKIEDEPRTAQLLTGIVQLFRALDLDVVAEGVENAEQYAHVTAAGCQLVQGYYTGRPGSAAETLNRLRGTHQRSPGPHSSPGP